jgi:hypothetical protein
MGNVFEKAMPRVVNDQLITANPRISLREFLSEKLPVKRTNTPKHKLNNGPATYPYLASVKLGMAILISYFGPKSVAELK